MFMLHFYEIPPPHTFYSFCVCVKGGGGVKVLFTYFLFTITVLCWLWKAMFYWPIIVKLTLNGGPSSILGVTRFRSPLKMPWYCPSARKNLILSPLSLPLAACFTSSSLKAPCNEKILKCKSESMKCIKGAWRVHEECMKSVWRVHEECMKSAWRVYEECMKSVWRVHEECMKSVWRVHGVSIKGA